MNVKLLRRVAKHILAEPKRFVMWTWMKNREDTYEGKFTSDAADNRQVPFAKCGTAACIGGWACILEGQRDTYDVEATAARLLGVDSEKGRKLFVVDAWPDKFKDAYQSAKGQKKFATIAANRIEHFIKTGE